MPTQDIIEKYQDAIIQIATPGGTGTGFYIKEFDVIVTNNHVVDNSAEVTRKLHQTIKKVGEDVPRLSYNTAIAAMMEYMNVMRRGERIPRVHEVEPIVRMVSPFAPHIAEELWERLGHDGSVFDAGWPSFDPSLVEEELIELAVQVNGKLRGRLKVPREITQDEAFSLAMY